MEIVVRFFFQLCFKVEVELIQDIHTYGFKKLGQQQLLFIVNEAWLYIPAALQSLTDSEAVKGKDSEVVKTDSKR